MEGLPTETHEDLEGIARLAEKVVESYYENPNRPKGRQVTVTVSVSCFIPKPFTAFQWEPQDTMEMLREKQEYLKSKITNRHASIDPIAGTAFRSGDVETDRKRTNALLKDPKENAEHVMLVDLARNDLSRNCQHVQVDFYKEVQYYSHVIHLVSRVSGDINPESNPIKTYMDTFPAGTLSGAPKVRAMQLITEIEHHNRGAYGGCIGFIGLNGDLNQAITIRSFVSRGNVLYYQAGAGIVAKSRDERELQEVNNKLGALKKAIILAESLEN